MAGEDLKSRTKKFALSIIRLYASLPERKMEVQIIGKQVVRSGTSVGAHYRESCRARSNAEFISKMQVGLQELEETLYWLELLSELRVSDANSLTALCKEATELLAIFVTSIKTAKSRSDLAN